MGDQQFQNIGDKTFGGQVHPHQFLPTDFEQGVEVSSFFGDVLSSHKPPAPKRGGEFANISSYVGIGHNGDVFDLQEDIAVFDKEYHGSGRLKMRLKRQFKLIRSYYQVNFKSLKIYQRDFAFGLISMAMEYASKVLILFFIFELVEDIKGWSYYQLLFLFGINTLALSLWSSFCIHTVSLPNYIRNGEMDGFLLRPLSPLFQIMMSGFDENSWGELVIGAMITAIAFINLKMSLSFALLLPVLVVSGAFIYAGISITLSATAFFTTTKSDFSNLTFQLYEFASYPVSIYPRSMRIFFSSLIPIGFVSYYPSLFFFRGESYVIYILSVPVVAFLYFGCSVFLWKMALRRYGSTGS